MEVYCDWRVSVHGCVGSKYFITVYHVAHVFAWLGVILIAMGLVIRALPHRRSFKSFFRGENNVQLIVFLICLAYAIQFLSVLAQMPDIVSGVFWTFPYPLFNFILAYQTSYLRQALPDSILDNHSSKWRPSGRTGTILLVTFAVLLLVFHVVVISASFALKQAGHVMRGQMLERCGLTITSICTLILVSFSLKVCFSLRGKILAVLETAKTFNKGEIDTTLLSLTATRLAQNVATCIVSAPSLIIFFLLLAHYPDFFKNMQCSMALMFVMVAFNSGVCFLYSLIATLFDIKRWLYDEQVKERSSGKGSHKGSTKDSVPKKEEITLPSITLSMAGKEQVDQIIDDLKPK